MKNGGAVWFHEEKWGGLMIFPQLYAGGAKIGGWGDGLVSGKRG